MSEIFGGDELKIIMQKIILVLIHRNAFHVFNVAIKEISDTEMTRADVGPNRTSTNKALDEIILVSIDMV